MAQPLLWIVPALMSALSTVLAVTDLTSASYKLVEFASFVAGAAHGEVVLVSAYGERGRRSEPPSDRPGSARWRTRTEARLRREGQLLERQRQWCAERGVRCRAELYEDGLWSEFVVQSAERAKANLILIGLYLLTGANEVPPQQVRILAQDAPCPVSVVRLPTLSVF